MKNTIQAIIFIIAIVMITITSCKKEDDLLNNNCSDTTTPDVTENGNNPDETMLADANNREAFSGFVYLMGNEAGTNLVHIYKQNVDGSLSYQGNVPTGGAGNNAALGSQGALALKDNNRILLCVNAGDNSISMFRTHLNGSITLLDTENSGGIKPVSICAYRNHVYVVNAGSDNINGYTYDSTGTLHQVPGSNLPLSGTGVGPAQIAFSQYGDFLYVTEKATNSITTFYVDNNGFPTPWSTIPASGMTPFGFSIARNEYLVVTNAAGGAANASSCTSYGGVSTGNLVAQNGNVANNQTAACWTALTRFERFVYVTNTGSDNISTYYVSPWGNIYLLHASTVGTGDAPTDICVAANNFYVYNINSMSRNISGYHRILLGGLISIGTTPGIPEFASGIVAW